MRRNDMKILFIGDSITDACRENDLDFGLGYGYVNYLAADLVQKYPRASFEIINRGISGDVIQGLKDRWEEDCLALKPDIVSLLIGINDTGFNEEKERFATSAEEERFTRLYRELVVSATELGIKVIIMEPFLVPSKIKREHWRKDLDPKIQGIRKIAQENQAIFVPLDGVLNALIINYGEQNFTRDGVHPSPASNREIADNWLKYVCPYLEQATNN